MDPLDESLPLLFDYNGLILFVVVSGALDILESSPPIVSSPTPDILSFGIIRFDGVFSYVD